MSPCIASTLPPIYLHVIFVCCLWVHCLQQNTFVEVVFYAELNKLAGFFPTLFTSCFLFLRHSKEENSTFLLAEISIWFCKAVWKHYNITGSLWHIQNKGLTSGVKQTPSNPRVQAAKWNLYWVHSLRNFILVWMFFPPFLLMKCLFISVTARWAQCVLQAHHLHHLHSQMWNISQMSDLSPRRWLQTYGFYLNESQTNRNPVSIICHNCR